MSFIRLLLVSLFLKVTWSDPFTPIGGNDNHNWNDGSESNSPSNSISDTSTPSLSRMPTPLLSNTPSPSLTNTYTSTQTISAIGSYLHTASTRPSSSSTQTSIVSQTPISTIAAVNPSSPYPTTQAMNFFTICYNSCINTCPSCGNNFCMSLCQQFLPNDENEPNPTPSVFRQSGTTSVSRSVTPFPYEYTPSQSPSNSVRSTYSSQISQSPYPSIYPSSTPFTSASMSTSVSDSCSTSASVSASISPSSELSPTSSSSLTALPTSSASIPSPLQTVAIQESYAFDATCAEGSYLLDTNLCAPCPSSPFVHAILIPGAVYIASILGLGILVSAITIPITKRYGGTIRGGLNRARYFLLTLWSILQILIQISDVYRRYPNLHPILYGLFTQLSVLTFHIPSTPTACLSIQPFLSQTIYGAMIVMIGIFVIVCIRSKIALLFIKWCLTLLFLLYGPLTKQFTSTFSCSEYSYESLHTILTAPEGVSNQTIVVVSTLYPSVFCGDSRQQIARLFSILALIGMWVGPIWISYIANRHASRLTPTYSICMVRKPPTQQVSLEEWNTEPLLQLFLNSPYQPTKSGWKLNELLSLVFLTVLLNLTDTYIGSSIALGYILLQFIIVGWFRPYRKETRFVLPVKGLTYLLSSTILGIRLTNSFEEGWTVPLLLTEFGMCLLVLIMAYFVSLIEGAQSEQHVIGFLLDAIQRLQMALKGVKHEQQRQMIVQSFLRDHPMISPMNLLEHAPSDLKQIIQTVRAIKSQTFQVVNPIQQSTVFVSVGTRPVSNSNYTLTKVVQEYTRAQFTPAHVKRKHGV